MNNSTMQRTKTMAHRERAKQLPQMVAGDSTPHYKRKTAWTLFSKIITVCFPGFLLSSCGMATPDVRQAWREKVALCFIIALISGSVFYITLFLGKQLCPDDLRTKSINSRLLLDDKKLNASSDIFNVRGQLFLKPTTSQPLYIQWLNQSNQTNISRGVDFSSLYVLPNTRKVCEGISSKVAQFQFVCEQAKSCITDDQLKPFQIKTKGSDKNSPSTTIFTWSQLRRMKGALVIDGVVLNMTDYFNTNSPEQQDTIDRILRNATFSTQKRFSRDITKTFLSKKELQKIVPCLTSKYMVGFVEKELPQCFLADYLFDFFLVVVLAMVLSRFFLALFFSWFLSEKLAKPPGLGKGMSYPPAMVPPPQRPIPPYPEVNGLKSKTAEVYLTSSEHQSHELYVAMLVTCYSEGETSLRCTLDSLASTVYTDLRKMLFVIADGDITGSGNTKSTPDILLDLIEEDFSWGVAQPYSYFAVGAGKKRENMARVHIGHYVHLGHRVPIVALIKCGTPDERLGKKAGNRGKRDSQIILMSFFSKVLFNERMSPLEYELFRKIHYLMGVPADYFEAVLMVDADTKVLSDSLGILVNAVINDTKIMGLCGETRIANKRDNFVTWIQVYEYYISHHLGKTFESVFGGVTCLPGCFCMYRLKAPGNAPGTWIPILTKPDIIEEYSQGVVETLHEKNLLLLGEDRFLTTLMIRNFPTRKMMFVPQAVCKTVVPDEFMVLVSQRRRWINSTLHNLLELVLVRNLCGTFCCSMQFAIFMELIGTVSLPVAIFMTYFLIVNMGITIHQKGLKMETTDWIPLILLIIVLFSPAFLILITTRKVVYVMWMMLYLCGLFVWNFILPIYAYWHFDDFSWGQTRQVEGDGEKDDHGSAEGYFDPARIPLQRWEVYEQEYRRYMRKNTSQRRVKVEELHSMNGYSSDASSYEKMEFD